MSSHPLYQTYIYIYLFTITILLPFLIYSYAFVIILLLLLLLLLDLFDCRNDLWWQYFFGKIIPGGIKIHIFGSHGILDGAIFNVQQKTFATIQQSDRNRTGMIH